MVILGIDPGFAIVGFGVIRSENGRQALLQCGAVTTPAGICESMENASGKSLLTRTIAITGKKTTNSMMIRLLLTPNL